MQGLTNQINKLLEARFSEEDLLDCFVVEIKLEQSKVLKVFIDSDEHLGFSKCKRVSRFLEEKIEENNWLPENYRIEVSSPGAEKPLKMLRQYAKHIGRTLIVETKIEDKYEGELTAVADDSITIEVLTDKKKKLKEAIQVNLSDVKKAKIKITFNSKKK
jgi:ribosome maturation factor RimP